MDVIGTRQEDTMFKHLSICAALLAFATGSANAQEQEAILQKVEVPGARFHMLVAVPKSSGVTYNLGNSPDALVVHLTGGKLVVGFDDAEQMLRAFDQLRGPAFGFHVPSKDGGSTIPAAVYIVPSGEVVASPLN